MLLRRNRTSSKYIFYALHLYFSGLSLRKASQCLSQFVKRNHVSIWNWIQKYNPEKMFHRKRRIDEFIVDETLIKVGNEFAWLWIATAEPKDKTILGIHISYERSMLIAEHFIHSLVKKYRKHSFLHNYLPFQLMFMVINMLYSDAFNINSLAMFGNFLADTYSPNILLIDENTVSAIHLFP